MWCEKSINETVKEFNVNLQNGLSSDEAKQKIKKYGLNKLTQKKQKSMFSLIFEQLNSVLIYILIAAAVISALLGEVSDAFIIAIVIVIDAAVGVIQESKAEKALDSLKKLSAPKAVVKRNGEIQEISSEEVVPGDIIIIDAGRYIPCDMRLFESANLKIEESALTGESVPSDKDCNSIFNEKDTPLGDQKNMAFASTLATYGRGAGIAVATGMDTEIGKIAKMLEEGKKELTPLQKKLEDLGKILGFAAIIICAAIFFVGISQKRNMFEMFLTSISLAVAAIPEGLPAIVTIVLAIGVQRMIKKNAIIRKLPAVETLGAVNIICSDKTGTLTQNKMTVTKFFADNTLDDISKCDMDNKVHNLLMENLILCSDAAVSENSKTGDPTEIALLEAGIKHNIFKDILQDKHPRIDEIPFDSERKLMTTVNKYEDGYYVFTKGAIDNLIKITNYAYIGGSIVPLTDEIKNAIANASNSMSNSALRVLGAAYKKINSNHIEIGELEKDLIFVGMVGMIDPPREEVMESIKTCLKSGIKTVMITGDHKNTAFAIAKELGIAKDDSEAVTGTELDKMTYDELKSRIGSLSVFARVSPEHKVKIVKALKSNGNIVSMTGDGVNDAPSLKIADIGVAMGITGTDVAKNASDMILTDDNFSTIVSAIEEGRNIYNNIEKSIFFLLSCNTGEILSLFFAVILGWDAPLKPIHILWVNLITDTLPALSLGVEPNDPEVMKEKPRDPKSGLLGNGKGIILALNGILIGGLTLTAFITGKHFYPGSLMHAQTMAFVVLSVSQLFHSLNMRHLSKSIFSIGLFTNKYIIISIIAGIFLQSIVITVPFLSKIFKVYPLTLRDWVYVGILSIMPLVINEIAKWGHTFTINTFL